MINRRPQAVSKAWECDIVSVSYQKKEKYGIDDLLQIMQILRGEGGCPWDREQTHESMRRDMLEEAYEVCEAIDLNDRDLLKEELGDVLLQVVHHARIEEEQGSRYVAERLFERNFGYGYAWQNWVRSTVIDEAPVYYLEMMLKVRSLLARRVDTAPVQDRPHYKAMLYAVTQMIDQTDYK